jgi:predicted nucleotidyltransferase
VTDLARLFGVLVDGGVRFILVGGAAATAHGAARLTQDIDIVYDRAAGNLTALVRALAPHRPYLRGAPPGLPFIWDERTLTAGLNFTLTTALGDVDLLGEIVGGGGHAELLSHTETLTVFGRTVLCIDLPTLIHVKRAAGRPKDLEAIAELELLLASR